MSTEPMPTVSGTLSVLGEDMDVIPASHLIDGADCQRASSGANDVCQCEPLIDTFLPPVQLAFPDASLIVSFFHPLKQVIFCTAMSALLMSGVANAESTSSGTVYDFDWPELGSLQFSRAAETVETQPGEIQTELLFKLSPGKFEFSPAGAFGLTGVFSNPELAVRSSPLRAIDARNSVPELHNGLSYSAGIKIEHEDENISGTAYVSSGQLGISYGRLGRVWYNGLDVSLGQFAGSHPQLATSEVLSFDLTTGRRMGWTGVGSQDPLWLLSLEGNFDMQSENGDKVTDNDGDWYLNPSLFWQNPRFTFSAQLQVPVDSKLSDDFEEPSYKLRAIFEKQFR